MTYLDDTAHAIRAELSADLVPEDSAELFRIYALLLRTKGSAVALADVHDAWAVWMQSRQPDHPAILPFAELDAETQREDVPFLEAIRRVAARAGE